MIILFYNKHKDVKIKYHNNIIGSEKNQKKIKKKFGEVWTFSAGLAEGGGGYTRNALQRSFDSL